MFSAPYVLIWITFAFYSVSSFFTLFQCKPIAKAWNPLIEDGHCLNIRALSTAVAIFNLLTDISILILPLRAIWNLELSKRKKAALSSVFLVGVMCVSLYTSIC